MNPKSLDPGAAYLALLAELARDVGVSPDAAGAQEAALGLAFTADGHTCRLLPHPTMEDRAVVEVSVCTLAPSGPGLIGAPQVHEFLNRLNAQARLEHDWVATVDDNDEVLLWTWRDLRNVTAMGVQELMADGLERAQSLAAALGAAAPSGDAQARPEGGTAASTGIDTAAWSPLRG